MGITFWIQQLLFPQACLGCKRAGHVLCPTCMNESLNPDIRWLYMHVPHLSAARYKHPHIKGSIRHLKNRADRSLAQNMARAMYNVSIADVSEWCLKKGIEHVYVVPIPWCTQRRAFDTKTHNHAGMLAKAWCAQDASFFSLSNILSCKRRVPKQALMHTKNERARNRADLYHVTQTCSKTAGYLVIDDMSTTGATLKSAVYTLRKAGAKHILVATFARK